MRPITAADVMNPEVLTVQDDMTVQELANFLIENEISGAPVEDSVGRLIGVVSVTDIALAVAQGTGPGRDGGGFFEREWDSGASHRELAALPLDDAELLVRDIMTPGVHSVSDEALVPEVAERMIENHIHRLLVTREGRVVGILSTSDLLGLLVEERE